MDGKRPGQPLTAASAAGHASRLLYIWDRALGRRFLVDTGAAISLFPASRRDKQQRPSPGTTRLVAANGTPIATFGTTELTIDLGFKQCKWSFTVANVDLPILGADFLSRYGLAVDLRSRRLLDLSSHDGIRLRKSASATLGLHTVHTDNIGQILTMEFPELLTPSFRTATAKHGVQHFIETTGPPPFAKARRLTPDKLAIAKKEFKLLEDLGIVRRSNSPFASPLHMVPKADGGHRPCGDYRNLNAATKPDRYPIPHIQDFAMNLRGARVFSKVDLYKGYYNIPVAEADIHKTAVITPFGLFEFLRLPFGLCNAAQSFQRLMDTVLRDIPCIFVYLDDILIATPDEASHRRALRQLFGRLREHGLAVNASKCVFGQAELTFLGHRITANGIAPLPDRVQAIEKFPTPTDKTSLQEFLGLLNYYHRFLPNAAHLLSPLHAMLKKEAGPFTWTDEHATAFAKAKSTLAHAALLVHPSATATTAVTIDASDKAVGGSLEQFLDGIWKPLAFFSSSLKPAETRYSTFDRELLAMYLAVKKFRHFVEGRPFHIYTDHKPLTFAMTTSTDYSPRQRRHLSYVAEFTTDIRHLPGKANLAADALSRNAPLQPTVSAVAPLPAVDFDLLAQAQRDDPETPAARTAITGLQWQDCPLDSGLTLLCDVSTGRPRPFVPPSWRRHVFEAVHNLAHPGIRATGKLLAERFIWHGLHKDSAAMARSCLACQRAKVHRHTSAPLQPFLPPGKRFEHIHVDIVGPLPHSAGCQYIFTMIDRFTRWVEAVPMRDATATSCAQVLLNHWVARFGIPLHLTSDRGRQFTSGLWEALGRLLGTKLWRTTSYHPQSNGMVERFHRQLKASLRARLVSPTWTDELPIVLLAIRATPKEDLACSPAELVFGSTVRLPGEFYETSTQVTAGPDDQQALLTCLRETIRGLRYTPPLAHGQARPSYTPPALRTAKFVLVRHDAHRSPLAAPYDGPFRVLERHDKHYVLDLNGQRDSVSIDRLKPATVDPTPSPAGSPTAIHLDHPYAIQ